MQQESQAKSSHYKDGRKIYPASFFQDHCMKGGAHYLQGKSCETTHLLIHYKTKTAPTRLYLILMFRLASYTVIKKNPNTEKNIHSLSFPKKPKKLTTATHTKKNHQNLEIPAIIQKKKSYSCGNPKQRSHSTEYGEHGELKEFVSRSIWMNEEENE